MMRRQVYYISCRSYWSASNVSKNIQNAKPFSEMPTISFHKAIVYSLPGGKYYKKTLKENFQLLNEEYGNIVRMPALLRKPEIVVTFNPDDFEKVYKVEGNWPVRYGLETLEFYRATSRQEIYGNQGNILIAHGEKWSQMRSIANPILMQPNTIKGYLTPVDDIAKEFVKLMKKIRNDGSEMPGDFAKYINMWSFESLAAIIFDRRFNLFDENIKNETAKTLINYVRYAAEEVIKFEGNLSFWKYYHTHEFKNLIDISNNIVDIVLSFVDLGIKQINEGNLSSKNTEISVLRKLIGIDKRVAVIVIIDLVLTGIETTASATLNTLYCLAKNPEKQEILRQELLKILPEKNSQLTPENTRNMPYLRAVIKESYRLFPVIQGFIRMTTKDVVLSGYHVPANTHVGMQPLFALQDEKFYPNPQKFLPERWLREQNGGCLRAEVSNPFTFLPFGFGKRSCVGKRIAELEVETILANIIRNFKIEWHYPDMKVKSTIVNFPDSEMRFKVTDV